MVPYSANFPDIVSSPKDGRFHGFDKRWMGNFKGGLCYTEVDKDKGGFGSVYSYDGEKLGEYSDLKNEIEWHPFITDIKRVTPSPELKKMLTDDKLIFNYLYGLDVVHDNVLHMDFTIPKETIARLKAEGETGFDREFTMKYNGKNVTVQFHIALTFEDFLTHYRDPDGVYNTDISYIDSHARYGTGPQGHLDECPAGLCDSLYSVRIPKETYYGSPGDREDSFNNYGTFDNEYFDYLVELPDSSVVVTSLRSGKGRWSHIPQTENYQLLIMKSCTSERFWDKFFKDSGSKRIDALVTTQPSAGNAFFEIYAGLLMGQSLERIAQDLDANRRPLHGRTGQWRVRRSGNY